MDNHITEEFVHANKISAYVKCFDIIDGKYLYRIEDCSCKFSNNSAAIRHLKQNHRNIASEIDVQKGIPGKSDTFEIRVKFNPVKIWNAIIRLIVFNSIPFAVVQSTGFRYLIKPFVDVGINFTVNQNQLHTQIEEKSEKIKQKIVEEVKGKVICLMLDIASRFNRSIFGKYIAYFSGGKIHIRTIGMNTLKVSQTGKNLFEIVKATLAKYGIDLDQIFAVTTDNGKNLKKMIEIAGEEPFDQNENI